MLKVIIQTVNKQTLATHLTASRELRGVRVWSTWIMTGSGYFASSNRPERDTKLAPNALGRGPPGSDDNIAVKRCNKRTSRRSQL
jgi:hypothetical protein